MSNYIEYYDDNNNNDENEINQAKDMGYKLAIEIRSLRKKNNEQKELIDDLNSSKTNLSNKYQTLTKQYTDTHKFNLEISTKCQKLQDLTSNLEVSSDLTI